ncbi:carbohydrate-binding protein, partial [Singulisphaera rosea]
AIVGVAILTAVWLTAFALIARDPHEKVRQIEADRKPLSKPSALVPRLPGPSETIVQLDGSIRLGAASATVHGASLRFETPYGNLGYWHDDGDYAVWIFRVDEPGTFALSLDYACQDRDSGNRFRVRVDKEVFRGRVSGTRSWSNYQSFLIGEITLGPGMHELEVRPEKPIIGALFDLRAVTLAPREGSDPSKELRPPSPATRPDEASRR